MFRHLENLLASRERGQGLAEYALILALIAVVVITAVIFLGGQINDIMVEIGNNV
jgi:pilus assembly protein Flp/PilA